MQKHDWSNNNASIWYNIVMVSSAIDQTLYVIC